MTLSLYIFVPKVFLKVLTIYYIYRHSTFSISTSFLIRFCPKRYSYKGFHYCSRSGIPCAEYPTIPASIANHDSRVVVVARNRQRSLAVLHLVHQVCLRASSVQVRSGRGPSNAMS